MFSLRWIGEARMAGGTHRDRSRRAPKYRLKPRRDRYFNMNLNNKCVCEVCSGSIRRNWKHAKIHNCDTCNFHFVPGGFEHIEKSATCEIARVANETTTKFGIANLRQVQHLSFYAGCMGEIAHVNMMEDGKCKFSHCENGRN